MNGLVFDIQRYCLHDGPGIRTVIFLKACPLSCVWCANPESQRPQPELMLTTMPCLICKECVSVCPREAITLESSETKLLAPIINWSLCDFCLDCVDVCVTGTLSRVGQALSLEEIMETIQLDLPYYARSGGGVTLSGGEPTAQAEFSQAILQACRSLGINTAIETSGACEWDGLAKLLPSTDLVFYDLKQIDSGLHVKHTGKPNVQILKNLERVVNNHAKVVVRYPLIPGYNDDDDHLEQLAEYLSSLDQNLEVELIPYHLLGVSKYQRLGRKYSLDDVAEIKVEALMEREALLQSMGMRIFRS